MKIKEWGWSSYRSAQSSQAVVRRKKRRMDCRGLATAIPANSRAIWRMDIHTDALPRSPSASSGASPASLLFSTIRSGTSEGVKELLSQGADVSVRDEEGNTPLHAALDRSLPLNTTEHWTLLRYLLEGRADVNCLNDKGNTPLHLAIESFMYFEPDFFERFLDDADISIRTSRGQYPFELFLQQLLKFPISTWTLQEWHSVLQLFVRKGTSPDVAADGTSLLCKLLDDFDDPTDAELAMSLLFQVGADPLCAGGPKRLMDQLHQRWDRSVWCGNELRAVQYLKMLKISADALISHPDPWSISRPQMPELQVDWWKRYQTLRVDIRDNFAHFKRYPSALEHHVAILHPLCGKLTRLSLKWIHSSPSNTGKLARVLLSFTLLDALSEALNPTVMEWHKECSIISALFAGRLGTVYEFVGACGLEASCLAALDFWTHSLGKACRTIQGWIELEF